MSDQLGPESNKTFLDRGTVIALVLVGALWFGWSKWVETQYPSARKTAVPESASTVPGASGASPSGAEKLPSAATSSNTSQAIAPVNASAGTAVANATLGTESVLAPESFEAIETSQWVGRLSSHGMALVGTDLKNYKTRDDKPILIGTHTGGLFATKLLGASTPISFSLSKDGESAWVGTANLDGYQVIKRLELVKDGEAAGRALTVTTSAKGDLTKFPGFAVSISDVVQAPASSSFLAPSYDHFDWFVRHEDTKTRSIIAPDKPAVLEHKTVLSAALSSHYFTSAIADRSSLRPDFRAEAVAKTGEQYVSSGVLTYKPMSKSDEFKIEQVIFVGAKDMKALRAADAELAQVIDYGMFAVLAEPLLWLMRLFFSWFGNWGFAIIGLTIVVRAVVLPFNIYSFKSMKIMQQIQPQIQQARERYKDDPRRMNEEVMRLMKENKANPLGGCLPMLLQLPVFFALYQVLAMSMDLYRQPFIFWIHDLTVKDPFFVLPILMGISMFLQQKITPVADPQQAKILLWMPVVFSLLMFTLPSGLTLYIFVSTLFGIAQQYVLMRDKSPAQTQKTVHEAKA